jgi:predicted enzyme related to lactoylglutathione lyase
MIVDDEKNLLVQLHHLDGEEHGEVEIAKDTPRGAGVLIYILVDDVRAVHARAVEIGADVKTEPTFLELAHHTEFIVADPDGYRLAVYSPGER